MKKSLLFFSIMTLSIPFSCSATTAASVSLDGFILDLIDGMTIGINGHRIYKIKKLGKELVKLLQEISEVIKELQLLGLDPDSNQPEVQVKLTEIKEKLHEITTPFMDDMDGFKPIVQDLIKD